jgi:hypothetical protein
VSGVSSHASSDLPVVLRTSWARIVALALMIPACVSLSFVVPFLLDDRAERHGFPAAISAAVIPYLAVVTAVNVWSQRRNCLVLRAGALTVRSGWRSHVLPAADVQAVTLDRTLGSRYVMLWLADGSSRRVVVAGRTRGVFRQNFDADYHLIGDWWLANRGAGWRPSAPPRAAPVPLDFDWNPNS